MDKHRKKMEESMYQTARKLKRRYFKKIMNQWI